MRLNLTQHGKPHQVRTQQGLTDCELFLDSVEGGAWPFLVRGLVCLVNSVNERELYLIIVLSLACRAYLKLYGDTLFHLVFDSLLKCREEDQQWFFIYVDEEVN